MAPKYQIGQKVVVATAKNKELFAIGYHLEPYTGQTGEVTNYYWISPNRGEFFYIYTARMEGDDTEVVFHEDELRTAYSVGIERHLISTIVSPIRALFHRPSRKP